MLQPPWKFHLEVDVLTCVGCSVAVVCIVGAFAAILIQNARRMRSTEALQTQSAPRPEIWQFSAGDEVPQHARAHHAGQKTRQEQSNGIALANFVAKEYKGGIVDTPEFSQEAEELIDSLGKYNGFTMRSMLLAPFSSTFFLKKRLESLGGATQTDPMWKMKFWGHAEYQEPTTIECAKEFIQQPGGLWLLPVMLGGNIGMIFFALPFITNGVAASVLLCCPLMISFVVLGKLALLLSRDQEFVCVDGFANHRAMQGWSLKNLIRVGGMGYVFFESASLSARFLSNTKTKSEDEPTSEYENVKHALSMVLESIGLWRFNTAALPDTACFLIVFTVCFAIVCIWVVLYHPNIHAVMKSSSSELSDYFANRPRWVCVRMHMYEHMKTKKAYAAAFLFLSDTVFIPVVTNLMKALDCSYGHGRAVLRLAPEVRCWTGWHPWIASVAVVGVYLYVPTALFGAAFILADSDGIFASAELDVLLESRFLVIQGIIKVCLAFTSTFIGPLSPAWGLVAQFALNLYAVYYILTIKPCSILFLNYAYAGALSSAAWFSLQALYDTMTTIEWWPFIFIVLGSFVTFALGVHKVVSARPLSEDFVQTETFGGNQAGYDDYHIQFDDMSCLRGHVHRLRQITFWVDPEYENIFDLQCIWEMDGCIFYGPMRYASGLPDSGQDRKKLDFVLEPDEHILGLRGQWIPNHLRVAFITNKREFALGKPDDIRSLSERVDVEEGCVVVGLHGSQGYQLHHIGLIVQRNPLSQKQNGLGYSAFER